MINIDLNNIKKWGDTWLVKFNPNKTEIMIFNIRNQQDELSFDFDGIVHNSVNKHKHLGIIISSDCKWTKHIDSLIQKTSKQLNVLRKLSTRREVTSVSSTNNTNRHDIAEILSKAALNTIILTSALKE